MKKIVMKRAYLLQCLESILPAVPPKPTVQQSNCFAFRKGFVYAFDGEFLCRSQTKLPDEIMGAVHAKPLVFALRKLEIEDVEISIEETEFVVAAKRDEIRIRLDPKIQLPLETVEKPDKWTTLPEDFGTAFEMVAECSGKDVKNPIVICTHMTPDWIEATDGFTYCRYKLATGLKQNAFVYSQYCKPIGTRGPTKIAVTDNWLHFSNGTGLRMALRWFNPSRMGGDKLLRFNEVVKIRGTPTPFPKSLISAASLGEIFSGENSDNNFVTVQLSPGFVKVIGEGATGKALHKSKVDYKGQSLAFTVGPKLLAGIIEKHNDTEITATRLIVAANKFYFCTSLKEITKPQPQKEADNGESSPR